MLPDVEIRAYLHGDELSGLRLQLVSAENKLTFFLKYYHVLDYSGHKKNRSKLNLNVLGCAGFLNRIFMLTH